MRKSVLLCGLALFVGCGDGKDDSDSGTASGTTTPTGTTTTGSTTSCPDGDSDGVCDDVDLCDGDDASGDPDGDGLCSDLDPCPSDAAPNDDDDADGVCNVDDLCEGDDATGDTDADAVCDDTDLCPNDALPDEDADLDGVCNSDDLCDGDDATGDTDYDLVCDDLDPCPVDPLDDSDGDGVCDGVDECLGDDSLGDLDLDGVCVDLDLCAGDDATGDSDADGVCDDSDVCANADDATCTAVTDVWFLTGYFSEWGSGDSWTTTRESDTPGTCAARAGLARGDCLRVDYMRDPDGDGAGPNFSGWFWQYPANNWGQDDDGDGMPDLGSGYPVGAATQVSFWAWGASGGEQVEFKAGIGGAGDAAELSTGNLILTTTPTPYTIDVSGAGFTDVIGGFAWIMPWDVAPMAGTVSFYVDDIVWE